MLLPTIKGLNEFIPMMGRDDIGFRDGLGFGDTTPIMETEMEQTWKMRWKVGL